MLPQEHTSSMTDDTARQTLNPIDSVVLTLLHMDAVGIASPCHLKLISIFVIPLFKKKKRLITKGKQGEVLSAITITREKSPP